MVVALLGKKVGMAQVYDDEGVIHPVTVLEMGPCHVLQIRTLEKDGYHALQLGFDDKPRRTSNQAERGHVSKVNAEPKRFIKEVRLPIPAEQEAGSVLKVDIFKGVPAVDVVGTMKGRGFSGVVKRHGFSGLETGHGVQKHHKAPGSIGCRTFPGRVIKGRRLPGHYGHSRKTIQNLKVVRVDEENGLLLVEGGVPGPNGGYVLVRKTKKAKPNSIEKKPAVKKK